MSFEVIWQLSVETVWNVTGYLLVISSCVRTMSHWIGRCYISHEFQMLSIRTKTKKKPCKPSASDMRTHSFVLDTKMSCYGGLGHRIICNNHLTFKSCSNNILTLLTNLVFCPVGRVRTLLMQQAQVKYRRLNLMMLLTQRRPNLQNLPDWPRQTRPTLAGYDSALSISGCESMIPWGHVVCSWLCSIVSLKIMSRLNLCPLNWLVPFDSEISWMMFVVHCRWS